MENVFMLIPLFVLRQNVTKYHENIQPYFEILPEEAESLANINLLFSIGIFVLVLTPLQQVMLIFLYYKKGNPYFKVKVEVF